MQAYRSVSDVPLDIDAELAGVVVKADKRRLARVIANLLDNAAKYGDGCNKGCVHLSLGDKGRLLTLHRLDQSVVAFRLFLSCFERCVERVLISYTHGIYMLLERIDSPAFSHQTSFASSLRRPRPDRKRALAALGSSHRPPLEGLLRP